MSEEKRKTTQHEIEKGNGCGNFEVKKRFGEADATAVERASKSLRNRMRKQLKNCATGEIIGRMSWEVAERKQIKNKVVLLVRWRIVEIC